MGLIIGLRWVERRSSKATIRPSNQRIDGSKFTRPTFTGLVGLWCCEHVGDVDWPNHGPLEITWLQNTGLKVASLVQFDRQNKRQREDVVAASLG